MAEKNLDKHSEERLEWIHWQLHRYDNLRSTVSNRASVVLSANAILLAGLSFLVDKVLGSGIQIGVIERSFILIALTVTLFLLVISMNNSITTLANVWKTSRKMFGDKLSKRLFYSPADTINEFEHFEQFKQKLEDIEIYELIGFAYGELWTNIN